jgi:hypothetical protein
LLSSRPWPNESDNGFLKHSWHRALDARLRRGDLRSYRGGDQRSFFIHPANSAKLDRGAWFAVLDRVEDGYVPPCQRDNVELVLDLDAWLGPPRNEPFVFIACGRDVPSGRFLRWLASITSQSRGDWGAIVIDDGGSRSTQDFLRATLSPFRDRVTLLCLRERRGGLANTIWASRYLCRNPESVIVLVDADDALLGAGVLERLAREYESGADLTVGSMLRTDKTSVVAVDFTDPRSNRGGGVWQHLRTFRRYLFDHVPDEYFRLDGEYVPLAWDWALMLPLVEIARAPRHIAEPLYLHEPSGVGKRGESRQQRESIIARLIAKPSLRLRRKT